MEQINGPYATGKYILDGAKTAAPETCETVKVLDHIAEARSLASSILSSLSEAHDKLFGPRAEKDQGKHPTPVPNGFFDNAHSCLRDVTEMLKQANILAARIRGI